MKVGVYDMSEISGTELGKYSIRIRKKIGKGKQRNSQEERKTGNVTFGKKNTSEITGHEWGKCDDRRTGKTTGN